MKRLSPEDRKTQILKAAVQQAVEQGYLSLTRDSVAKAARVSPALVSRYFYCIAELRKTVMREAIRKQHLSVVAQGIVLRDPEALAAPEETRLRAVAGLGV